ncbi:MAG: hypothetical protein ABI587_17180, partial [Gemmatimonadales bacterium]
VFDGHADSAEYGSASAIIVRPAGNIPVWLRRDGEFIYLAASIADSTFYWGDDFVISLDIHGDASRAPDHDDFQWYFRRVADSSVIYRGDTGKWRLPQDNPDWRLGAAREGGGWEVRVTSDSAGWSIEMRLDPAYFTESGSVSPRLAFRVFDNEPMGWFPWPRPAGIRQPTDVERRPELWAVVAR